MAYENLCMYCFEDLEGQTTCPHCGRDSHAAVPQIQMLPGSLVYHDRFLIGRALGQDAAGIVYSAFDTKRENRLRIREYMPRDCAERLNDGTVVPIAGKEDQFEAGLNKLRATVEGVEDPRKRHFIFEENGTAYIAQRKNVASGRDSARDEEDDEPEERSSGRVLLFAGIAVAVLVVAAVVLITLFNGAMTNSEDVNQSPTLDPDQIWIPDATPTATPYVAPTFAALVDPELSWMEYTYDGDVEADYQQAQRQTATPKPTAQPTLKPTAQAGGGSQYPLINANSSAADIRALQQRLADLGWLNSSQITGKYDRNTRQAVLDFQNYVNTAVNPPEKLSVDGSAGPKTQQWLYQADLTRPTPTPVPTPTPTPRITPNPQDSQTVDENSPAASVRHVQQMLITLGLLPEGSADGSYGATTAAAVRRFQQRVNQLAGYEVLPVTGKVDPQSMAFLEYYAQEWEALRNATAVPTATPAPTQAPTATATNRPVETFEGVIDANSPADQIVNVQTLLIGIGMLPEGSADGIYGSATISAVADFQQWVNAQRQEQTLTVNGEVDQLTLAYLQYCMDHGMRPYGTPTPAPTQAPATPTPTAQPEEDEPGEVDEDITVDANSDPESIRYVQDMLSAVGLMEPGSADGVYGQITTAAVARFQRWVNSVRGEGTLSVTGIVDNETRLALEYAYDHDLVIDDTDPSPATQAPTEAPTQAPTEAPTQAPTEAPTEAPTPAPTEAPTPEPVNEPEDEPLEGGEIAINANSDPESIRFVQQMLSSVGLLDSGSVDGVYGDTTTAAVRAFQNWVNEVQGHTVLDVTGQVDDLTRQALEYAFEHDMRYPSATEAPTQAPTPEPTAAPTEVPGVGEVDNVVLSFGDVIANGSVIEVPEGSFPVRWHAEGDIAGYYVVVEDGSGRSLVSQKTQDTSLTVNTESMNPGEIYTLRLGVAPARGSEDDVVWQAARFTLPQRATQAPTEAPTPEPTEVPTEAPTPAPAVGVVSAPAITIAGVAPGGSPVLIESDSFQIGWSASGDVDSYYVRIVDENGRDIADPRQTGETGFNLSSAAMQANTVYTLIVGAMPVNGSQADLQISQAQFMKPVQATPEPTPEPTEAPTPEPQVARIGSPVVTVGGSAYQQDGISIMTGNSIIISWAADGDVADYTVYVENQSGETQNLGTTTDTSVTVRAQSLPAGIYTIYVGARPANGTGDDILWSSTRFGIPAPTEAPTPEPTSEPVQSFSLEDLSGPIDRDTDPEIINQLQLKLYGLGILPKDVQAGVLDKGTLQAVAVFQERVGLEPLDPTDPESVVDELTLRALFE